MSCGPRRDHSAPFRAKVAIEALAEGKTIAEIARKRKAHPHRVAPWRRQFIARAAWEFEAPAGWPKRRRWTAWRCTPSSATGPSRPIPGKVHSCPQGRLTGREAMIDRDHRLLVKGRAALLAISRDPVDDQPAAMAEAAGAHRLAARRRAGAQDVAFRGEALARHDAFASLRTQVLPRHRVDLRARCDRW